MRITTNSTLFFSLWITLTLSHPGFTSVIQVRLVDSSAPNAGRVQIGYKGVWKSVCDTSWHFTKANVVCRMLGYDQGAAAAIRGMTSSDDVWLSTLRCNLGHETTIEECKISNRKKSLRACAHHRRAGVVCKSALDPNITVRLADGRTQSQGRVEVRYYGIWGTVCTKYGWDLADAHVVCRMLNYSKASWTGTAKVQGKGPILLKTVMCNGKERTLKDCTQMSWGDSFCNHKKDANVTCEDEKHQSSIDVQVRLAGSNLSHFGRVEVQYNGTWIPVCDDTWDMLDAHVVCRMLGYKGALAAIKKISVGHRGLWLSGLGCNGDEQSINECYHHGWTNKKCLTRSNYNAAVICKVKNDPGPNVAVRLMNGSTPNEGRVEVRYYGVWGTACSRHGWGMRDAHVVCRMLNYSKASLAGIAKVKGSGPILLDILKCNGNEKSLEHCPDIRWGRNEQCSHNSDAGVRCEMTTQNDLSIDVRLVKTKQKNVGAVEVKYKGTWRPVCDDSWSILEARVVCRMLGYKSARAGITRYTGRYDGMWVRGVVCSGDEVSIGKCSHPEWSNTTTCPGNFYAGVMCITNKDPPPLQVRLEEGSSPNSGRVAVRYGNVWGTVCNKGLDINDAKVICRMLGYPGASKVYPVNSFVFSSDIIWLSKLACNGTETSIADCRHPGWGQTNCRENDGGIVCKPADAPQFQISATKGISSRVVILFDKSHTTDAQMKSLYQVAVEKIKKFQHLKSYEQPTHFVYNEVNVTMAKQMGNDSYITAEIPGPISNLTIGDGQYYHGYYNAPLAPGSMYRVHVRIVTMAMDGKRIFGHSAFVAFTTKTRNQDKGTSKVIQQHDKHLVIGLLIFMAILLVLLQPAYYFVISKYRNRTKQIRKAESEMEDLKNLLHENTNLKTQF